MVWSTIAYIAGIGIGWVAKWIGGIVMKVFVNWWLHWVRKKILAAIAVSDFKVRRVSAFEPLMIQLSFSIHNGSASSICLKRIAAHLYCSGAYVGSLVSRVPEHPLILVKDTKINASGDREVSLQMVPDLRFWLSTSVPHGFTLRSSNIDVSTVWGTLRKPLEPKSVEADMEPHEQIKDYVSKIHKYLSSRV